MPSPGCSGPPSFPSGTGPPGARHPMRFGEDPVVSALRENSPLSRGLPKPKPVHQSG